MKKTALVLGGNGFLGYNLIKKLKEQDYYVSCVDIKFNDFDRRIIADDLVFANLNDPITLTKILKIPRGGVGFDELFQLASDTGGSFYTNNKLYESEILINSVSTNINVARYITQTEIKKLLFVGTTRSDSVFSTEKTFSENIYSKVGRDYKVPMTFPKYGCIFGPGNTYHKGRESTLCRICMDVIKASNGDELDIDTYIDESPYLFIDDCVDHMIKCMRENNTPDSNGYSISNIELANLIVKISGKDIVIKNSENNNAVYNSKFIADLTTTYNWILEDYTT